MSTVMLKLNQVRRVFAGTVAVDDLSLEIAKGEFIAIMGPSGCGKTTTLRLIAGLEQPDAGSIELWGRRIDALEPWEREMPMVWQSYALFPFLSVRKNVEFGLKQRRLPAAVRRAKAEEWMERLDIAPLAERSIGALSGGQKQRVGIARALATEPEMLLLDEPLSALDPHLRIRMQSELLDLHRRLRITFVYITHSQSEAFAMADRVVIMNEGRIEQIGDPRSVYRRPATRFVAEFLGGNNVIDGTVSATGGGMAEVDTPIGVLQSDASGKNVFEGDKVAVVVPADQIRLQRPSDPPEGSNRIACTLATLELVGSSITAFLMAPGGQLRAQLSLHDLERLSLEPGSAVTATWFEKDGFILT